MAKMIGVIAPGGMTFESLFAAPCPWYAPGVAERAEYLIKQYMAHEGFTFVDAENENFSASECIAIIHWSRINKELLYKVPKVLHIYLAHEPHLSRTYNLKAGMDQLSRVLDYILSIYVDAANEQKGIYVTPGYYNFDVRFSPAIQSPKYLLATVSGDKDAILPKELYTARREVIDWFEKKHPDLFRFYGSGWSEKYKRYKTYGGPAKCKLACLSEATFSLCFENVRDQQGYITEKLFDGMNAGTVPVYWGGKDVFKWIPKDLFVDYRQFNTPEALFNGLIAMQKEEVQSYLERIHTWLHSENKDIFSWKNTAQNLIECISRGKRAHPMAIDYTFMCVQFKISGILATANNYKHNKRIEKEQKEISVTD